MAIKRSIILFITTLFSTQLVQAANEPADAESETLSISRRLRPISDDQWQSVAGNHVSEIYEIASGDTLWDISNRLFGDAFYWPKVWALNNGNITNPHFILPRGKVNFQPGTGTSLPSVGFGDSPAQGAPAGTPVASRGSFLPGRSQEWRNLPRQPWETVVTQLPAEVDPNGFDRRNKVLFSQSSGLDLKAIAQTEELPFLGKIVHASSGAAQLSLGDEVYISPEDEGSIEVGQTYSVTEAAMPLNSDVDGRDGYGYLNIATIKIISSKEDIFVGQIVSSHFPVNRGQFLIPLIKKYPMINPVAGTEALEATTLILKDQNTQVTSQHDQIFIDRGTEDGIAPGMVFRAYQYKDPSDHSEITNTEMIPEADFMVIQTSEQFSSAIGISSRNPISNRAKLILLTDVSDLRSKGDLEPEIPVAPTGTTTEDDLDSLSPDNSLNADEEKELKQLEEYKDEDKVESAPKEDLDEEDSSDDEFFDEEDEEAPADSEKAAPDAAPPASPSEESSDDEEFFEEKDQSSTETLSPDAKPADELSEEDDGGSMDTESKSSSEKSAGPADPTAPTQESTTKDSTSDDGADDDVFFEDSVGN